MLKLTNKFNTLHTWSVSWGILFTLVYKFNLKIRSFQKKRNFKRVLLSSYGVYIKLACSFQKISISQESELTILVVFSLLNTNIKVMFSYLVQLSQIFMSKSKQDHNYRYLSTAITLCYKKIFNIFLGSQGGSHGRVWNHMKFITFYALLSKEIAYYFQILHF